MNQSGRNLYRPYSLISIRIGNRPGDVVIHQPDDGLVIRILLQRDDMLITTILIHLNRLQGVIHKRCGLGESNLDGLRQFYDVALCRICRRIVKGLALFAYLKVKGAQLFILQVIAALHHICRHVDRDVVILRNRGIGR